MLHLPLTGTAKPLAVLVLTGITAIAIPAAHADNKRLNDGVVANVYTVQHHAGCRNDVTINPQLQLAAEWHTHDLMANRGLDGDIGSDGSTPESRSAAAGFRGHVAETVAINPAVAISGIEVMNQWYHNPVDYAVMSDCANTQIGVWSENSPDRTVLVAIYGQPPPSPTSPAHSPDATVQASAPGGVPDIPIDPSPDYDASDELEFGVDWFAWILRGAYPPPDYPPN